MGFDLRYPNITAPDERGQLIQMKSYLHQLVEQLQWALSSTDAQSTSSVVASTKNGVANADTSNTIDRAATFNAIKSLIITSADIVEAYYEEINKKLSGLYVAESDFGTFVEATNNNISATSTRIDQTYSDTQVIKDSLSEVTLYVKDTKANIRSGILYYVNDAGEENMEEGTPVYGVEVGQENEINGVTEFRKYARFISNRLSFYDENDNEVAYISDRKLYITDVEVTGSYKIGGLRDYVSPRGSVVTKYVGS